MIEEFEDAVNFCLEENVTPREFFMLYLLARRDFHQDGCQMKAFIAKFGKFTPDEVEDLSERKLIDNFNSRGEHLPELMVVSNKFTNKFTASEDTGEELWRNFPPSFPLSTGGEFIALAGGEKSELLELYRKKIKHSKKKHLFVLEQLEIFKELVRRGEVNGCKISDWIKEEKWDTVARLNKEASNFGKDI